MSPRAVSFVALASLVVACGASTTSSGPGDGGGGGSGSGSSSSGGSSSGGGPGSGPCPSSAPSTALSSPTPCSKSLEGVSCEYGNDLDPGCDTVVACVNGVWSGAGGSRLQSCPTPPASGACPATYAAAQSAGACTQQGLACGYAQGRCDCATPTGGPPTVGVISTKWLCDNASSDCPAPRPRIGSACSGAHECNYGACTIPDGVTLSCTSGTWQVSPTACAE